ncbi:zinc finger BED domain-containing protein 1-like [Melanaphis sacchari]|uniref:zinc finger BED domain-containing protein 1-like n=1 Tax=Melanaphis sacchari TaxID=742174 RepID=UPI000DC146F1|nr:zinc finger BED domain-containing protein 1-like [Melanaphis sacchari]
MSMLGKSWVWQYAKRIENKAYCNLCDEDDNNEFSCPGGTTGSLGRHLTTIHGLMVNAVVNKEQLRTHDEQQPENDSDEVMDIDETNKEINLEKNGRSRKRKRRTNIHYQNTNNGNNARSCSKDRCELINKALAKMIAVNQLPLSFCSSNGFHDFMSVVEPNYKPCKEEAIKTRLKILSSNIEELIKNDLQDASSICCTTDCWTSISQESYITVTAHVIDSKWCAKSYTLTTHEMDKRHTAENLSEQLINTFGKWDITNKILAIVTDNAKNITNAIPLISPEIYSVKWHFKHSTLAKTSLEEKQELLGLTKTTLLQSCKTRWNSIYLMMERLVLNRCAIFNVLADRTITSQSMAQKLEIKEHEWLFIESLIQFLKPIYVTTNIFYTIVQTLKQTLASEIKRRFSLEWDSTESVLLEQIASFLDPRFKDLDHEVLSNHEAIRSKIKQIINQNNYLEPNEITTASQEQQNKHRSDLEYIFGINNEKNDLTKEFQNYLAEPQLRFTLDPLEWWKTRYSKYPTIGKLAKKYMAITATSVSAERCFSTAGNIVTRKRASLSPENVNLLVFLHQNKRLMI